MLNTSEKINFKDNFVFSLKLHHNVAFEEFYNPLKKKDQK